MDSHNFPYTIKVKAYTFVHDNIEVDITRLLGLPHGECRMADIEAYCRSKNGELTDGYTEEDFFNDFPRCADIDVESYQDFEEYMKSHPEYTMYEEDKIGKFGADGFLYPHSHIGVWKTYGFHKTGYDYGIQTYAFKDKNDLVKILLAMSLDVVKQPETNNRLLP